MEQKRFSYRANPILKMIETGDITGMKVARQPICSHPDALKHFQRVFTSYSPLFAMDVKFMTEPFYNAVHASDGKLGSIVAHENRVGTMMWDRLTVCYLYENAGLENEHNIICFFDEDSLILFMDSIPLAGHQISYIAPDVWERAGYDNPDDFKNVIMYTVGLAHAFLKYAEVEQKILTPNKKTEFINCNYLNESKSNIQLLNCTWFTDLIQNNPFWVRGHFRLQPCGEGLKDRKLIWIDPFVKEGYIRKHSKPDEAA